MIVGCLMVLGLQEATKTNRGTVVDHVDMGHFRRSQGNLERSEWEPWKTTRNPWKTKGNLGRPRKHTLPM